MPDDFVNLTQFGLPPMRRWVRDLLGGLLALYIVELVVANFVKSLYDTLGWSSFGSGFEPWQPLTRYFVQGPDPLNVLFSLIILFFTLSSLEGILSRRTLAVAMLTAAAGGIAFDVLLDVLGIVEGQRLGWGVFATAAITYFGFGLGTQPIRLFFLITVPAALVAWGTGLILLLFFLATRHVGAADHLGTWLGAFGWWFGLGPGGRRRRLLRRGKKIEKELSKFQVIQGGRDDTIH